MSVAPEGSPENRIQGWPDPDGRPLACREKLKVLGENHEELRQVMQDAFEDALLMGVDEAAMRRIIGGLVDGLVSPRRTTG